MHDNYLLEAWISLHPKTKTGGVLGEDQRSDPRIWKWHPCAQGLRGSFDGAYKDRAFPLRGPCSGHRAGRGAG